MPLLFSQPTIRQYLILGPILLDFTIWLSLFLRITQVTAETMNITELLTNSSESDILTLAVT